MPTKKKPGKSKDGPAQKKSAEPKKGKVSEKPAAGIAKPGKLSKDQSVLPDSSQQRPPTSQNAKKSSVAELTEHRPDPDATTHHSASGTEEKVEVDVKSSEDIGAEDDPAALLDENESLQLLFFDEDDEEEIEYDEEFEVEESTLSIPSEMDLGIPVESKAKVKRLDEDEKLTLMHRRDSELTRPQMVEKDIIWYDLLTGDEAADVMGPEPVFVESATDVMQFEEEEDEEEEEVMSGEEEEEHAPEMDEAVQEQPPPQIEDDPDNIANFMMDEEENEGIELLFMDAGAIEPDAQSIATFPGVVGLNLSEKTLQWLEMRDLEELDPPHAYISFKRVKLHMYMHQEASEFYPYRDILTHYPDFAILIGVDTTKATGHSHFMCTSLEGRNMVLHPPKAKKKHSDIKKTEEEMWKKMASIAPRKWRSLGSELEVDLEAKYTERPLITMHGYRYFEAFHRPYEFTDSGFENNKNALAGFDSLDPGKVPLLEISEMDVAVQVMPQKTASSTQTGFSFKRNKICQYENQFLDPESARMILEKSADGILKKTRALQRALLQNEMMNLPRNDYKDALKALKGHDIEYNDQSIILEEYHTYCDLTHSKGRCVTWMTFHPTLEDVVVIALAADVTLDKRIDFYSKLVTDPNFVLFWDLKEPTHPQIMLDAPAGVFCFMMNPSDPQIVCGGCANGQVVLWDLGREYVDLRARVQDRRRKVKDKGTTSLQFLDILLKDSAEKKYSCPLIVPVGLSNLDQSHNKIVTSVSWLPSHVELGKNGTLYENLAGKSFQFFSTAGDGTVRVWDIRPPKLGMDDYDAVPSDIRSNVYLHLENNNWKHSNKYYLEDENGGILFATILSLSENRQSDIVAFDTLMRLDTIQKSGSSTTTLGGTIDVKDISDINASHKSDVTHEGNPNSGEILEGAHSGTALVDTDSTSTQGRGLSGMRSVLGSVQSSIFIGTETGQVGLVDWFKNKDGPINADAGQRVFYNIFIKTIHDGPITSIARSPFYFNLILVVGGGTVSIWKETSSQPLLAMAGSELFPWCGVWSNTRPAVFFVGTREGALQVWDLTERSNAPVLIQQISPDRITNVAIPRVKFAKKQFLALSDSAGTVYVMILSSYLHKPNKTENAFMIELITREEKRHLHWVADADNRHERMELIHNNWKESRVLKTEEEIYALESQVESRLNAEYSEFLEFETKLASRLKLEEPSISTESLEVDVKFHELYNAAKERATTRSDESGTEEEDEVEESPDISPMGSEYDFLTRTRQASVALAPKVALDSSNEEMDY